MSRTPTHRAEGAPVLLKGSRLAPRAAAVVGGAIAATAIVGAGGATAQADEATWDRVAQCESSGRWSVNTGNGYYGGLQFSRSTWNEFGGQAYASTADKASKDQQIAVARRVLASQGPGAWPVCSKKAGLTKTTGDADRSAQPGYGSSGTKTPANPAPSTPTSAKLVVDGRFGPKTTRALESWAGVSADGSLSKADIKAVQRKVGANPDGVIGRETTRKLQQAIGAPTNGAKSFRTDRATVRVLQDYLNRR
ncbi:transglycosylase family protein [Brachybacterium huguangmaarense]|uniref:transglycosylase family protein n=1 Tax=Brachybacterium huguangmaarense TaxID=1652028 RepID=UPI002963DBF3|nr:transglycosylase family protein [Brachybacterium huguangmaarense]